MTDHELINTFPARYLDAREEKNIADIKDGGLALIRAAAVFDVKVSYIRKGLNVARVNVITVPSGGEKNGRIISVVWFNRPYVKGKVTGGAEYLFYGKIKVSKNGAREIVNPVFEDVKSLKSLPGIIPVYSRNAEYGAAALKLRIRAALKRCRPESLLPAAVAQKYGIMPLARAYGIIHNPADYGSLEEARRAAALESLSFKIALYRVISGGGQKRARLYAGDEAKLTAFTDSLPFKMTGSQQTAVRDIIRDLKGGNIMNRLLQGDVGSGKTAVALCAAYYAVLSGYQAAFMAPTEVLARQHYYNAVRYFDRFGVRIALVTGSLKKEERGLAAFNIKHGVAEIVIGTHALFSEGLEFKDLGLIITDEQHRFGVTQRKLLEDKARFPDTLVMSATPIPRTLSLIMYGDLNISSLTEKPHAGGDIKTNFVSGAKIPDMYGFIAKELEDGAAAYFVCPRIEDEAGEFDEDDGLVNVKGLAAELKKSILGKYGVGTLHGKMKEPEKAAALDRFREGKDKVLVSTTVIEVGIDIKTASVIVIYNAERFGLSQLHQLRGRVGRAGQKSWCFLICGSDSEETLERLNMLKSTNDGFALSEYDFKTRGAGELLGEKQHGAGGLPASFETVAEAKEIAGELLKDKNMLAALEKTAAESDDLDSLTRITMN